MELAKRNEVPVGLTWDLSAIYPDEAAMQKDAERIPLLAQRLEEEFKGRLTSAESILRCLDRYRELLLPLGLVQNYCSLAAEVDYTDAALQESNERIQRMAAKTASRLSFIESEILAQEEAVLHEAIRQGGANQPMLLALLRQKPYQLSSETERVLAALGPALHAPYQIYNMAKLADMRFPSFMAGGEEHPLGYSLFEDSYEYCPCTEVRRAAFTAFSGKLREYENVTAAAYQAAVQTEKTLADQRGFSSVFDYLLFPQQVTREMYDRQIDLIMQKLAPHMRRYARLLQKCHRLERMTYADIKLTLDPEYDPRVSIEQSQRYIEEGLSVMGPEYQEMIRAAYRERWVANRQAASAQAPTAPTPIFC